MPSKGWMSLGEPLVYVSVRLQESLVQFVDDHAKAMHARMPSVKIGRGDAMRDLIMLAQRCLQEHQGEDAPQPQPTPPMQPQPAQMPLTTQPAIPIALEGVPASQAQPLAPAPVAEPQAARKSKTPSSRRKDGKGGNPGLPDEKLQQIADTAAQYDKISLHELSQLLYDRGIHRATDSTTGEEKPVNPGTLKRQLDRAREQGLL